MNLSTIERLKIIIYQIKNVQNILCNNSSTLVRIEVEEIKKALKAWSKINFHTEKYNLIIDLLSKFEDEKRQRFEISNSITSTNYDEDYFSRLRGTYFIYTYASACIYCANFYYHLTERFPNLIFKIFYTVPYTNEDKTLTKFFNSPFRVQRSLFYADCKRKTSNIQFVDDYDDLKDCFKEKYDKLTEGLIKFPRFSFQKLPTFGTTFTLVKKLMDM